jgi:hypothetical protein
VSKNGERPVVVYHGGAGDQVALQFVEKEGVLVGKRCDAAQCCTPSVDLTANYIYLFFLSLLTPLFDLK